MTGTDHRQKIRDAIRDKVLARWVECAYGGDAPDLPVEGDCDRIADWVMELFPEVSVDLYLDGHRYELHTAFEPLTTSTEETRTNG